MHTLIVTVQSGTLFESSETRTQNYFIFLCGRIKIADRKKDFKLQNTHSEYQTKSQARNQSTSMPKKGCKHVLSAHIHYT